MDKKGFFKNIASALAFAIGPALAGFFIGQGITNFKNSGRTVTVKGLHEEAVKADRAVWDLSFVTSADVFADALDKSTSDTEKVRAFLLKQGFQEGEISLGKTKVKDAKTREYGEQKGDRYIIESSLRVTTQNVDGVVMAVNQVPDLIKDGVLVDAGDTYQTNPSYFYDQFEERRPEMYTKAIESAKKMGAQFASETGTQLGRILNGSQGKFEFYGLNQADEFDHKKSPLKRIRLVTALTFELR